MTVRANYDSFNLRMGGSDAAPTHGGALDQQPPPQAPHQIKPSAVNPHQEQQQQWPPAPCSTDAARDRRRRICFFGLVAAAVAALLLGVAVAAALVISGRLKGTGHVDRAAAAASGIAILETTWAAKLYPAGSNGLPRATASPEPDASGVLFIDVEKPTANTVQEAWRAQLRSGFLQLPAVGRAYSLLLEARSMTPNATARLTLHSQPLGKAVASNVVYLTEGWAQHSLRLVQPRAEDEDGPNYTFQVHLGGQGGRREFRGMRILVHAIDEAAAAPEAAAARIERHRVGNFTLVVLGGAAGGGEGAPVAVTGLNLTLVRHHFAFGTAIEPEVVLAKYGGEVHARYLELIVENFWSITPENAFKWPRYEPERGRYQANLALLKEQYVAFAQNNSIPHVRGHTLEWGEAYNDMLTGKDPVPFWPLKGRDCALYMAALEGRVKRDVALFRGGFTSYDVLNELIEMPSMLRACGLITTEMIPQIFGWARAADPGAQLCLNEWAVLEGNNWQGLVELARPLLQAGAPVDCIGVQAHLTVNKASDAMMWRRLDEVASLGLPIFITELSLSTGSDPVLGLFSDLPESDQAAALERLVTLFFSHPAVAGVTLWGFFDGHVWVKGSGIFRDDLSPKPAAEALKRLWRQTHNTTLQDLRPSAPAAEAEAAEAEAAEAEAAEAEAVEVGTAAAAAAAAAGDRWRRPAGAVAWRGYYGRYAYEYFDGSGKRRSGTFDVKPGGSPLVKLRAA